MTGEFHGRLEYDSIFEIFSADENMDNLSVKIVLHFLMNYQNRENHLRVEFVEIWKFTLVTTLVFSVKMTI